MKLSEFKTALKGLETIGFQLPDGSQVPGHFHVTEVGQIDKRFIDCGGTIRTEKVVSLQLWENNDYDHRLHPAKLIEIIRLSERELGIEDLPIEVEYQAQTISKYHLSFNGEMFELVATQTNCLAEDKCVAPPTKKKIKLATINAEGCCTPGSGCC